MARYYAPRGAAVPGTPAAVAAYQPPIDLAEPHLIRLQGVSRSYCDGEREIRVLDSVDLAVSRGELVAVTGRSGSGKTTLLNLIAGLDRPDAGVVEVCGQRLSELSERRLTRVRARRVGVVFQDPHLLGGLSALENVIVARLPWARAARLRPEASSLLRSVGLGERLDHPPARLSGGERQRVAVARALLGARPILLADEPSGNLDDDNARELFALFAGLCQRLGLAVVVATHDAQVREVATRQLVLGGGTLREASPIAEA
jgi:ABC-type lipoprotein export system ATPase subunit